MREQKPPVSSKPFWIQVVLGWGSLLLAALGLVAFNLGYVGWYAAFLPLLCLGMGLLVEVANDFFLPLLLLSVAIALVYAVGLFALPLTLLALGLAAPVLRVFHAWGWVAIPGTVRLDPHPVWRLLELFGILFLSLFVRYFFYRAGGGRIPLAVGEFESIARLLVGEVVGWSVFASLYGLQHRVRHGVPFFPDTDFARSFVSLVATGLFLVSPHAVMMSLGLNLFGAAGLYVGALPVGAAHMLTRTLTLRRLEIERQSQMVQEMAVERARNERLVVVGQMSSAISHQILQQVGLLGIQCDVVRELLAEAPSSEAVSEARERVEQLDFVLRDLNATLSDLLVFSRDFELHLSSHSLTEVVEETVRELGGRSAASGVRILWYRVGEEDQCCFDRIKLKQALLNLVVNAVEASPPGGEVRVEVDVGEASKVRVVVSDEGGGIPPEHLENIFSPFFSTKEKGKGLGLTFAQKIVDLHRGLLTVQNSPGRGCTFVVELPRGK